MKKPENKFPKTLSELVADPVFVDAVKQVWIKLKTNRMLRPSPPAGMKYRRDWYDRLVLAGNDNAGFFVGNIPSCVEMRSDLSAEMRQVVLEVFQRAQAITWHHYLKEMAEAKQVKPAKKRNPRSKAPKAQTTQVSE